MDSKHAVKVLREHNEWRRGDRLETWERMPYSPAELGAAIDSVCDALAERDRMLGEAARIIRAHINNKFATDADKFGFVRVLDGETFLSAYDASKKEKV